MNAKFSSQRISVFRFPAITEDLPGLPSLHITATSQTLSLPSADFINSQSSIPAWQNLDGQRLEKFRPCHLALSRSTFSTHLPRIHSREIETRTEGASNAKRRWRLGGKFQLPFRHPAVTHCHGMAKTAYAFTMHKYMRKQTLRQKILLDKAEIVARNRETEQLLPKEETLSARQIAKCVEVFKTTFGRIKRSICVKYNHMLFSRNRTSSFKKGGSTYFRERISPFLCRILHSNCSSRIRRIAVNRICT